MNNKENNLPVIEEEEVVRPPKAKLDPKEVERSRQVVLDYIGMKTREHPTSLKLQGTGESAKTPASPATGQGGQKHPPSLKLRRTSGNTEIIEHENMKTLKHKSSPEKIVVAEKKILKPKLKRFKDFLSSVRSVKKIKPEKEEKLKPAEKILKSAEEKKQEEAVFLRDIEQEIETVLEEKLETAKGPVMKAPEEKVMSIKPLRIGFREPAAKRSAMIVIKLIFLIICFLAVFVCAFHIMALPLFGR